MPVNVRRHGYIAPVPALSLSIGGAGDGLKPYLGWPLGAQVVAWRGE